MFNRWNISYITSQYSKGKSPGTDGLIICGVLPSLLGVNKGRSMTQNVRLIQDYWDSWFLYYIGLGILIQRSRDTFLWVRTRRKCPFSGILFAIAVEIFANSITNDQSIEGINVKGRECKVSHHVDDTSCFANVNSIQTLFQKLELSKNCPRLELPCKGWLHWSDLGVTLYNTSSPLKSLKI